MTSNGSYMVKQTDKMYKGGDQESMMGFVDDRSDTTFEKGT